MGCHGPHFAQKRPCGHHRVNGQGEAPLHLDRVEGIAQEPQLAPEGVPTDVLQAPAHIGDDPRRIELGDQDGPELVPEALEPVALARRPHSVATHVVPIPVQRLA